MTRDEEMALVEAASDEMARAVVDQAITLYAASGRPFSANSLRDLLPDVRPALLGARFYAAARRGLIRRIGYEQSTLRSTRRHPIAVWVGRFAARKAA